MPRSIGGFNSSTYGSFGEGDQISARALNRMGVGIDRATTMYSQGIQFQASNGGVAYNNPQEVVLTDAMVFTPEQFETRILPSTEEGVWQVQVARGRVIVGGGRQAVGEYDVQGFAIYPTGAKVNGSDSESPYVNQGGYVKISNAEYDGSNSWGVYIVSNPSEGNYPMLAVIAEGSDADTKSRPWTTRVAWIDVCPYTVSIITTPTPPYEVYLKSYDTVSSQHQANYNCQRIKIATLYWNIGTSSWIIRQWLIGSLTNPSIEWWNGNREYNSDDGIPSWATTTDYQTEQDAWNGPWTGYYKWDGSGASPSVNILP